MIIFFIFKLVIEIRFDWNGNRFIVFYKVIVFRFVVFGIILLSFKFLNLGLFNWIKLLNVFLVLMNFICLLINNVKLVVVFIEVYIVIVLVLLVIEICLCVL